MRSRPSSDSVSHPYHSSCPPRETQGPSTVCFCYCLYPNNSHILQSSLSLPTELYSPVVPLSKHMNFPAALQVQLFQKQSYCLSLLSRSPPSTRKHLLPCSSEPWWRAGWLFLNIQRTFLTLTPTFTQWPSSLELSPDLPLTVLVLSHHSQLQSHRCSLELSFLPCISFLKSFPSPFSSCPETNS